MSNTENTVQEIRTLLSAAQTEEAFSKTRQLLEHQQRYQEIVQLDMIESEWNSIRAQWINGLLDVDDQMRLQNINRAKLMELLLHVNDEKDLARNLNFAQAQSSPNLTNGGINQTVKDALKNVFGVLMILAALGSVLSRDWLLSACFGVAGLIAFVPTLQMLERSIGRPIQSWVKYVVIIGAMLVVGMTYKPKTNKNQPTTPDMEMKR